MVRATSDVDHLKSPQLTSGAETATAALPAPAAPHGRRRSVVPLSVLALAGFLAGCAMGAGGGATALSPSRAALGVGPCVLADSGAALDDLRAVAILVPRVRLVGVVVTEGVTTPDSGAMAMTHLLAARGVTAPLAVVVGDGSPAPAQESWIPEPRASAERLNGSLAGRDAHAALRAGGQGVWLDVPRGASPSYAPTPEMIQALGATGLPGTRRAIHFANPNSWADTLMRDDSAVLYLLHPQAFAVKGAHLEPAVAPDEIRRLWLAASNGG